MARKIFALASLFVATSLATTPARADVVYYSDASSFAAQGTIASTLNLDSFGTSGGYIGGAYGDLAFNHTTYVEGANGSTYAPVRDVAIDTYLQNVIVDVDSSVHHYNMLSVNAGLYYGAATASSPVIFYITTNLSTYGFSVTLQPANSSLTFEGFIAGPGEYITKIDGYHNTIEVHPGGVGITDISLGVTGAAVPEPSSLTLAAIAGVVGLVGARIRRSRRP